LTSTVEREHSKVGRPPDLSDRAPSRCIRDSCLSAFDAGFPSIAISLTIPCYPGAAVRSLNDTIKLFSVTHFSILRRAIAITPRLHRQRAICAWHPASRRVYLVLEINRKTDMSDDDDENGNVDAEHIGRITGEIAKAIAAGTVALKLESGREIVGTIEGFAIRSKVKKDDVIWSGNIKIRTEPGVLQVDVLTVEAVTPR
jgi:hypothetical protein